MRRIEREDGFYCDESGERFRQLFAEAELKRADRNKALRLTGFWLIVFSVGMAVLLGKLWSMGALAGVK